MGVTVYFFAIITLIYFFVMPKTDVQPSFYMYPIFLALLIYLIKEGYFKGIFIEIFKLVKHHRIYILVFTTLLLLIVFILDRPLAIILKELNIKNIDVLNRISGFGNKLGNGSFLYSIIAMLIITGIIMKNKIELFKVSMVSSIFAGIFVSIAKILISRERPPVELNSLDFFAYSEAIGKHLFTKFEYVSMPSGHTITIVAAVVPLIMHVNSKVAKVLLILLPLFTIFDRIYTNAHWTSDTFAGAVLGILIGVASYNINQNKIRGIKGVDN